MMLGILNWNGRINGTFVRVCLAPLSHLSSFPLFLHYYAYHVPT
jgi:hypothetical protein